MLYTYQGKEKMAKKVYSQMQVNIVNLLAQYPDGLTIAQMSEKLGTKVQPGTVNGLVRANLVSPIGVVQIERPVKDKVCTYAMGNPDKVEGKNYSDNELKIMDSMAKMEGSFTLAQLAEVVGIARVTPGHINGLVKVGNMVKTDVMVEVIRMAKAENNLYIKNPDHDIPADAEVR